MNSTSTRRMYRRISAEYPGWYIVGGAMQHAVVRDVSLNGFRIEGPADLPCNTIIPVRVWLPEQENSLKIDQAVVRWAKGWEFGVQIVGLSNEEDLRLANHVEWMLERGSIPPTKPRAEAGMNGQLRSVGVRTQDDSPGVLNQAE